MSNILKIVIIVACVLVIAAGVYFLYGQQPSTTSAGGPAGVATMDPAPTTPPDTIPNSQKISAADHDSFVASAIPACAESAARDPRVIKAGISSVAIENYCRCVAIKSADVITQDEMNSIAQQGTLPPSFQEKTRTITAACAADNLKQQKMIRSTR